MAIVPGDRKYTQEHQWIQLANDEATIGMTDFAQTVLGHIVHVELPSTGTSFKAGVPIGSIESHSKVIEFYMPVAGTVTSINEELWERPVKLNVDCYGTGWLIKARVSHLGNLLSAPAYKEYLNDELLKWM
ncbi:glycine cleavage system protein H [Streptomyces albidus (ex Kaewkla and Franco 2022)]|uniref:glycine cleavage system protein H n=1 Tax=Streptomyces albidus (ex Kaewkla and Franco 2022) TaxID=722709 RepID=UPI0015EE4357|nr:glycine cleavage system H protein [Streptomyces albidus (ex Kaewkla and Franco 2022)]